VHNPNQRPSLLEWHSWPPVPLLDGLPISTELDGSRRTRYYGPEREEAETHIITVPDSSLRPCRKVQSLGSNSRSDLS
jgi:hypothetical protein